MKFYDENTDLMKLIEDANAGDEQSMIHCINYFGTMGDEMSPILRELRDKYIDELVKRGITIGLIWKGDELLRGDVSKLDADLAMAHYFKAALEGDYFGLESIADMFFEGKGVSVDHNVARHLFWTALYLYEHSGNKSPSSMTYYKLGVIQEELVEDDEDYEFAKDLYSWAIEAVGDFAAIDEYACKAQEALWRLSA